MSARILLIDSDIGFMVTLKQALEQTGEFEVSVSANGLAAEDALRRSNHQLAVVGFDVGDMDVLQLIARLRNIQPKLPVIMMPETTMHHERLRFLDIHGSISKPFAARDLIPQIRSILARFQAPAPQTDDDFVPPEMPTSIRAMLERPPATEESLTADDSGAAGVAESPAEDESFFDEPVEDSGDEHAFAPALEPDILDEFDAFAQREQQDAWQLADTGDEGESWQDDVFDQPDDSIWYADDTTEDAADAAAPYAGDDEYEEISTGGLPDSEIPEDDTPQYDSPDNAMPPDGSTRILGDDSPALSDAEPAVTGKLPEWQDTDRTRQLAGTETLDDLIETHGLAEQATDRPAPDAVDDAPVRGVRRFLYQTDDAEDETFDEVLDVVSDAAQHAPEEDGDDRAFQDLVDSMRRREGEPTRRPSLEDLLESIAADTSNQPANARESDSTLDYVLEAIRRGAPLSATVNEEDVQESELDDSTIGDVINGLFDPGFEGVLAALAGQEVEDAGYEEPSYDRGKETPPVNVPESFSFDELDLDRQEAPDWLAEAGQDEDEAARPDSLPEAHAVSPHIPEPPTDDEEDSSRYPATAALNAVGADDQDDFSLTQLLEQIELQLPPSQNRPRLKPLPSWQQDLPEDSPEARHLSAMFDAIDSRPRAPLDEPDDTPESLAFDQDTRPTPSLYASEPPEAAPVPERATEPEPASEAASEAIPADEPGRDASAAADDFSAAGEDEPIPAPDDASFPDFSGSLELPPGMTAEADDYDFIEAFDTREGEPDELASMADLIELADMPDETDQPGETDEPAAADEGVMDEQEIDEQGIDEQGIDEQVSDEEWPEEWPAETGDFEPAEAAPEAPAEHPAPPPASIPESPPAAAARATVDEPPIDEEEDTLAQVAVKLTRFSLESSAQGLMLSRPGEPLADAGDLPPEAITRLFETVDSAWHNSPPESSSLIRYIALPGSGEYLLYSARVEDDMRLSMVFNANTSVRAIRRQARRLSESLELVPEKAPTAPDQAPGPRDTRDTLPSRPTDLRAPEGLREPEEAPAPDAGQAAAAPPPAAPPTPTTPYTCLWLPEDPRLELVADLADTLHNALQDVVSDQGWRLGAVDIQPDYVQLEIAVPQDITPDAAISTLMDASAAYLTEQYPDLLADDYVWADGYLTATPPRDLTEREIARFMLYQRQG